MVFCTACGTKLEDHWNSCPNCGSPLKKIIEPEQKPIISQQETMFPYIADKRVVKRKKKKLAIVMSLVIGLCVGFGIGATVVTVIQLMPLHADNDELQRDYDALMNDYNDLFGDFQSLLLLIESDPLTDPATPTIDEIYSWLESDNTDTFNYTENFMCGDFSVMLMGGAKLMNWRMRISCMFYSFDGEDGWQDPTHPYGENGHAFNVILCQDIDGDGNEDWIYIEPQTDTVWYVIIDSIPYIHYEIWYTFAGGIIGTLWEESYYVNHYSYFS